MTVWDPLRASGPVDWIEHQVATGEPAHAWLLLGPVGSGKLPAALALAAALNCTEEPSVGCGHCSSCLRVLRQRHPDVHHVVPEGPLIPVDVIRELVIPEAARSPFEGAYKVFVIQEADRMNPAAQNALLKTLEEPQPDTIFVLISDREEDVLETIVSRCRVVRLEPVSEQRIIELLSGEGVGRHEALVAARLSEGDLSRARRLALEETARKRRGFWLGIPSRLTSPMDALDVAAEVIAEAKGAVKDREIAQKDEVAELAEAVGEGRGTATVKNALAKKHKRELRRLEQDVLADALGSLGSFYRDVVGIRSGGSEGVANIDIVETLSDWAGGRAADQDLVTAIERCVVTRGALTKNANVALAIESLFVDLARLVPPSSRVGADT